METYVIYQHVLMFVSLAALAAAATCGLAALLVKTLTPVLEWARGHGLQALFLVPFVFCMVWYGSTKGTISYPYTDVETRYLFDAGSYVTNDYIHVAFVKSVLVPDSANLYIDVRPGESTNDNDWVTILTTTFAAFSSPSNIPYACAISNDFQVYTDYTPGPSSHTNGVALIMMMLPDDGSTNRIAPVRTGIYVNGVREAPNPDITNGPPIRLLSTVIVPSSATETQTQEEEPQ